MGLHPTTVKAGECDGNRCSRAATLLPRLDWPRGRSKKTEGPKIPRSENPQAATAESAISAATADSEPRLPATFATIPAMPPAATKTAALIAVLIAFTTATITHTDDAHAFKLRLAKDSGADFNRWREPVVRMNLVPDCAPGLDKAKCKQAIIDAAAAWNSAGCGVKVSIATSKPIEGGEFKPWYNGRNDIFWANKSWTLGKLALAYAQTIRTKSGEHLESSVVYNARHYTWSDKPKSGLPSGMWSIGPTGVHELGHVLGIMHSLRMSYMNSSQAFVLDGTLPEDDSNAVCFLYSKGPFKCSKSPQCPHIGDSATGNEKIDKTLICKAGSCGDGPHRHPLANKAEGTACQDSFDCKPPARCGFRVGKLGICARPCATAADCSGGLSCVLASHSPVGGLCGKVGKPIGKNEAEGGCSSNAECISGYCHPHDGTQTCQFPCGGGYQCAGACAVTPGSSVAVCVLKPIKIGNECSSNIRCETGVCGGNPFDKRCVALCSKDADCGSGMGCHQLGHGGICVRKSGAAPGEMCSEDRFCASGMCVESVDGKRCRLPCSACAAGESCADVGGVKACMPLAGKLPMGASCTQKEQCATGTCAAMVPGRMCTTACKTTKDCPCGMACEDKLGSKVCVPFTPKLCVANGRGCASDLMCASDRCRDAVCREVCKLFEACPGGGVCRPDLARPGEGTCQSPGPNAAGDLCSDDNECATGFCPDDRCRTACDAGHACPSGSACTGKLGSLRFCVPEPVKDEPDTSAIDTAPAAPGPSSDGCSSHRTAPRDFAWWFIVAAAVLCLRTRRHPQHGDRSPTQ